MGYARFDSIFLHDGFWNGVQILPEDWIEESTTPLDPDPHDDGLPKEIHFYYKYHWSGLKTKDGTYDYFAEGHFGQLIYVAPRRNVAIVRLGDETDYFVHWDLFLKKTG